MNCSMSLRAKRSNLRSEIASALLRTLPRNDDNGFSIVEMIVVISLISIILGIFIVRSSGMQDQRLIDTAKGDLRAIQTAINNYYFHHANTYPSGVDWLSNDLVNDTPRVLRQVLYDPFVTTGGKRWVHLGGPMGPDKLIISEKQEYTYFQSSNGKYYVVFSYGPDRQRDISSIDNNGKLTGTNDDDIFVTNGTGRSSESKIKHLSGN